ncbi:P-loop containing nucleoside triphosphate hydrolase protein [Violaceomyces palustris]|uniref:P-loop containing nucleoside triphosphate hydrolase protein n=1 Tax=Violaceomyces palustris TaxID=1673888 RepID=A0ACD0NT59_9BASI|nr:P-loop containing nucleoside triphosphate hydrolase protein [Violaceomyces palustris]
MRFLRSLGRPYQPRRSLGKPFIPPPPSSRQFRLPKTFPSSLTTNLPYLGKGWNGSRSALIPWPLPSSPHHHHYSTVPSSRTPTSLPPPDPSKVAQERLRNISIIAHIDAGKTTLTERLLHLTNSLSPPSNTTTSLSSGPLPGDVDSGSTVTDFLEQERQRGITIQSAAVGPVWWQSQGSSSKEKSEGPQGPRRIGSNDRNDDERVGITLVDTPGHIDFGIEVERALRVVDGAVMVLDGVEGVESQTEMVWSQSKRYGLESTLVFVNKLDRLGSCLSRSVRSILEKGLHPRPLILQLPLPADGAGMTEGIRGLVDLVTLKRLHFRGRAGEVVERSPLESEGGEEAEILSEAVKARHHLVESLASLDDQLLEELLLASEIEGEHQDAHSILPAESIKGAIRRQTLKGNVLPVLCGSAAKNIGVQPLLDAIVDYLPAPTDRPPVSGTMRESKGRGGKERQSRRASLGKLGSKKRAQRQAGSEEAAVSSSGQGGSVVQLTSSSGEDRNQVGQNDQEAIEEERKVEIRLEDDFTTALAFKVVWDKRKGPITFVRVYSGSLTRSSSILNTTTGNKERLSRIMLPFADQYIETETLRAGQIGVLLGLKDTRTGDTLVDPRISESSSSSSSSSSSDLIQGGGGGDLKTLRLRRVHVPPPVFSMSVEPFSKSDEVSVNEALSMLVRTDPSLRLDEGGAATGSSTAGQTILGGLGELHLEIAKDRLENEFGVRARMGGVKVSYRETLNDELCPEGGYRVEEMVERELGGKKIKAGCSIIVRSLREGEVGDPTCGDNLVQVDLDEDEACPTSGKEVEEEDILSYLDEGPDRRKGEGSKVSKRGDQFQEDEGGGAAGMEKESMRNHLRNGILAALSRGPMTSNPLTNLHVRLEKPKTFGPLLSTPSSLSYVAGSALRKALSPPRTTNHPSSDEEEKGQQGTKRRTCLMEPMMKVRIQIDEKDLGKVVSDLTSEQGANILDVEQQQQNLLLVQRDSHQERIYLPPESSMESGKVKGIGGGGGGGGGQNRKTTIKALVPLSNLVSYSSRLRALTGGNGNFDMRLHGFTKVSRARQDDILNQLGRF